MPTSIQNLNRIYRRTYWRLTVGISIFYVLTVVAGLSLLFGNPNVATWIADAAQAEYGGADQNSSPEAVHLAQPNESVRQAEAN